MVKTEKKSFVIAAALVVVLVVFTGMLVYTSNPEIELSKEDALKLMDLQSKAVMAVADRDDYVQYLMVKYSASLGKYDLNIAEGKFVPKRSQNVRSKNDAKTADDAASDGGT